jgi:DNA-binding NarL/FixJ family response regulator
MAITCLLADDHPAILTAISMYLAAEGINVVGNAGTGAETIDLVERRRPDVLLLDVRLPDLTGVEVARTLQCSHPETPIVLYTAMAGRALVSEAMDIGVRGVVVKDAPLADLPRALGIVAAGGTYLDATLGHLLERREGEVELTKREREVLHALTEGRTYEAIGARLFLSPDTVRAHARKAALRLGTRTKTEAVAVAIRRGLIP